MNEAIDDTEREEAKKAYEKAKENDQEYNQYQGTYSKNLNHKQLIKKYAAKPLLFAILIRWKMTSKSKPMPFLLSLTKQISVMI